MGVMNDDSISSGTVIWSDSTATGSVIQDWQYYPASDFAVDIQGGLRISGTISSKQWQELEKEVNKLKEANKMAQVGLFEVYVVDTKNRKYMSNVLIAKDESAAKLKQAQGLQRWLDENKINEDFIEYFVRTVGIWEDKKPKEVKIVKE